MVGAGGPSAGSADLPGGGPRPERAGGRRRHPTRKEHSKAGKQGDSVPKEGSSVGVYMGLGK